MTHCFFFFLVTMQMVDGILCLNINLSTHFRVGSRSPATFKTKLYQQQSTTVSSHHLFCITKSSILDVAKGLIQNTLNTISNTLTKLMEFHHVIREYYFAKWVGSIVNNIERINTRKRSTINIVHCSKC